MKVVNKYGYCYYCVCDDCAMIYNLYVEKEHRRKGNARKILLKAIAEIREIYNGDIKIKAESDEGLDKNILVKFYKELNLKVID